MRWFSEECSSCSRRSNIQLHNLKVGCDNVWHNKSVCRLHHFVLQVERKFASLQFLIWPDFTAATEARLRQACPKLSMNPKQSRFTALVAALRLPAEVNLLQPLDLEAVSAVSQLDWEELCPFIGLQVASGNDTSKWQNKHLFCFRYSRKGGRREDERDALHLPDGFVQH